ncbi:hypothetical protein BCR32DRAFT_270997 [Anaeromyces robustus]|uniref:RRM domain-containing protein n=1 Tax=Anaeromyces robustus TaxID=1754192 RepID=A0A1Y1WTN2_9FUNG|nr:hypothetical protein BCR32DRAFT_270997 [Anaeromyces robustus]|eukprot:ORX76883.1 hypothetical protein BCR32DRAFT_270997 [Anaeromyces robustus]
MVEPVNNLNNKTAEVEKANITYMRSENENNTSEIEMTSQNQKMEGNNTNGIFSGNNENTMGKDGQNLSSPVMYYNYNGFIPYPYFPMQTAAEGSFYQPVPAQVPRTANPPQNTNTTTMFSSPHPTPVATSMVPMNRIPSNSSNVTPTNEMVSSGPNVLPTPSTNLPTSAIPPPMSAMPRIPYFPPQLSPSPLPMMPSNFNVAQPYSSPSPGFAPLVPTMNAAPAPMNGHRFHYNKGHHHYMPNNNGNSNPYYNGNSNQTTNNLYIKGLKPEINDELLQDLCKKWGTIVSSKAIIDNKTNECKGYGFVMYKTEEQAKLAMTELNNMGYQVSFAKESFSTRLKNLQDNVSTNIYMSNLPLEMNETEFLELFQPYKVVSSIILYDQTGASRGVGLAKLEKREEAQIIIDKYANKILPGGKNPLQVRFADSEAQKKLKGQTIHKKTYRNGQDYHNPHQRGNVPYYNQYRGVNNFGPRNKIPFPPQMTYMAQPVWPMISDAAPMPIGMNNPYMMNPTPQMNPQQPIQNGMIEVNNNIEMESQDNNANNQSMDANNLEMHPKVNNNDLNGPNFKAVSPGKNINHQGISFPEILANNAETNCIASAVESNME